MTACELGPMKSNRVSVAIRVDVGARMAPAGVATVLVDVVTTRAGDCRKGSDMTPSFLFGDRRFEGEGEGEGEGGRLDMVLDDEERHDDDMREEIGALGTAA